MMKRALPSSLRIPSPCPQAKARLICFPYAGAGASVFSQFARSFPGSIEVAIVQLPGREDRLGEPRYHEMGELVPGMCADLTTVFDLPCAFFGYSLGALIAFEVARSLRWANLPPLRHLFLAAKGSPRLKPPHPPRSSMSDEELLFELKRIGGMREAVLQDRELLELFLPILRADFALNDHYQYKSSEPLSCPVTVFGGTADREVPLPALMDWELETRSSFSLVEVPGDHFFLHSHTKLIQEQILRKLSPSDT